MNAEKLVSFLGHTSTSEVFESFLIENGIRKMPKGDCTTTIKTKDNLISMEFNPTDSYKKRAISPPVGEGWFTLESFDINKGFDGVIPFEINFSMDKTKIEEKLGNSFNKTQDNLVQKYLKDNHVIIIFYKNKGKSIATIRVRKINKFDSEDINFN